MTLARKGSAFFVLLAFVIVSQFGVIGAVENHNLTWGVDVGDRGNYHYSLRRSDLTGNKDFDFYVEIESLPTIPSNITDNPYLGSASANPWNTYFSFYYMNDTEITIGSLHWSVYPIGNWSLIEDFALTEVNTTLWDVETLDTESEWGLSMFSEDSRGVHSYTARYSKISGSMIFFEDSMQYTDGGYRTRKITLSTEGTSSRVLIGIGISMIGILTVVVVIYKKH